MDSSLEISVRVAGLDDVPEILRQRRGMYAAMGIRDQTALAAMMAASQPCLSTGIADGSFRCWLAEAGCQVVGGGLVIVSPWLAHPNDASCRHATVLNVYTYPEFRRRGVGRAIMKTVIDWCRTQGFANVFLHASDEGRPLYESLGFQDSNELKLRLNEPGKKKP